MGKLDTLAGQLAQRMHVAPAVACSALCLVLKAHHGDRTAGAQVTSMASASPRAAALLAEALRTLQREPSFWVSHYASQTPAALRARVASGTRTGDLFGDVASVVSDPGKAIAKAVTDVTHDPLGSLGNVIQGALNAAVPLDLLKPIPGLGSIAQMAKSFSPLSSMGKLATAALHGNMAGVLDVAKTELSHLQSVAAMVPGLGTGVSMAIGAAEALLSGGNPIELALRAAYGAIPIPPGIRDVTDVVLETIIALVHGGNITDIALTVARDRVPAGLPRDVFDTLAQIIVRHQPILKAAGELAVHEAMKAAQGLGPALMQGLAKNVPSGVAGILSKLPDPSKSFPGLPANVLGLAGLVDKLPSNMKKLAAGPVAQLAAKMPRPVVAPPSPPRPPPKHVALRLGPAPAPPPRHIALSLGPSSAALSANAPYDMFAASPA
jgi:hypothetical protein